MDENLVENNSIWVIDKGGRRGVDRSVGAV